MPTAHAGVEDTLMALGSQELQGLHTHTHSRIADTLKEISAAYLQVFALCARVEVLCRHSARVFPA